MSSNWNRLGLPVAALAIATSACGSEAGQVGFANETIGESDGGGPSSSSSPAPSPSAGAMSSTPTETSALVAARAGISWEKRGRPESADRIAGCKDGSIYALNYDKGLWRSTSGVDGTWAYLGKASGVVSMTCNDRLWVSGADRTLYRNDGTPTAISWTWVGQPTGARQVTAGYLASGASAVYALNDDNSLWSSPTGANGSWTRLGAPMEASRVAGSVGGVYALNGDRHLYRGSGSDNGWVYLDYPFAARMISDDGSVRSGAIWALNDNQELYRGVVNAGGDGEICRPPCAGSVATQLACDRCDTGLRCGKVGRCVVSGGANEPCNELELIIGGGVVPSCDSSSLTCVTLERGPTCIADAGKKGKTCRNASASNGACDTGLVCDQSNHICVTAPRPFDLWRGTWEMWLFSKMAYWETNSRVTSQQNCANKFNSNIKLIEYAQNNLVEALAAKDDTRVIVAFRGSANVTDWIKDLKIGKRAFHGVQVHNGFADYAERVWPSVKSIVATQLSQNRTREIWLAGHSLGGAIAQLIAVKLEEQYKSDPLGVPTIRVITFAAPMIGGSDWAKLYEGYPGLREASQRWVNMDDIGPNMPDDISFRDWQHVGLRNHMIYNVTQNCDLKGFSTWGEYMEQYPGQKPVCTTTSGVKVLLNTGETNLRLLDERFTHHMADSYTSSLRQVTPSSYASIANVSCSP